MKKIYKVLIVLAVMAVAMSCDLEKDLDSPNDVGPEAADPDLILNKIQTDFALFFAKAAGNQNVNTRGVSTLIRHRAMTGADTYDRAFTPQLGNDIWEDAYGKTLINIETLLPLTVDKQLNAHAGVAKILKAYTLFTLVDVYGPVPFTEALQGADGIFNPNVTDGATIYAAALALLAEGRTDLANTTGTGGEIKRDIYYGGDRAKWTTLANSLELRAQLNLGNASAVSALITAGDLIDTDAEEFTYKYGTAIVPTISRSGIYQAYYGPNAGAANGYVGNYFLFHMYRDPNLNVQDPRWRYFFYRQAGSRARMLEEDAESVPCALTPTPPHYLAEGHPFCTFEPGFFGRDHGNNDGGPPDGSTLTCVGPYPYGGRIDTNDGDPNYFSATAQGQGGNGAGIEPMYMSWFTDFMHAEAVLTLSVAGDARALMLSGVQKSISRTRSFSASIGQSLPEGLEPSEITYLNTLGGFFDTSTDQQDVVLKEYYKSLYGNGIDAYNLYRRTGSPKLMQPTRAVAGGNFVYSLPYPANFVTLNSSVDQKTGDATQVRVFWDKGLTLR